MSVIFLLCNYEHMLCFCMRGGISDGGVPRMRECPLGRGVPNELELLYRSVPIPVRSGMVPTEFEIRTKLDLVRRSLLFRGRSRLEIVLVPKSFSFRWKRIIRQYIATMWAVFPFPYTKLSGYNLSVVWRSITYHWPVSVLTFLTEGLVCDRLFFKIPGMSKRVKSSAY